MQIDKIVIQTGNYFEVYTYQKAIEIDNKYRLTKPLRKQRRDRKNNKEINPDYVLKASARAKNKIRRLIVGNMWQAPERLRFVTLTFRKSLTDLNEANYQFQLYRQLIGRKMKKPLSYVAVPEIQPKRFKRTGEAVWHFHYIAFNQPYYDVKTEIEPMWRNGLCWVNEVYKTEGTGNYLAKYLSKSYADPRMKNRKRYYNAVDHQPISIYHPTTTAHIHHNLLNTANPIRDYPLYRNNNKDEPVGHKEEFILLS